MSSVVERLPTDRGIVGIRRWGSAAPDVVLVHGAGGSRDSLAPLGDALATAGLAVATLSLPGRGGSDGPPASSIGVAAGVVATVLEHLAPDGTVLLGHSMGGAVAMEVTLATGAAVHGLVLAATGARLRVHPEILARAETTAAEGGHLAELSAMALRPDGPPAVRTHVLTVEALTPGHAALADWQAVDDFDRMDDVPRMDLPVLVVAGDADVLTPARYAAYLADHAPSAELVVLPGAGHWLPVEDADRVADVVAAFVRRLDHRPDGEGVPRPRS